MSDEEEKSSLLNELLGKLQTIVRTEGVGGSVSETKINKQVFIEEEETPDGHLVNERTMFGVLGCGCITKQNEIYCRTDCCGSYVCKNCLRICCKCHRKLCPRCFKESGGRFYCKKHMVLRFLGF